MTEKNYDVIGLGSALMDFLVKVDENKIVELGLTKGNFHLKEKSVLDYLIESGINFSSAPGGSAANTIKAIAHLGGKAILYGAIGNDELGKQFRSEYLIESGINFSSAPGGSAANTIKAIAHLGGKAILYGAIGNDELGKQF